jgi:tetratricopeptide (TPR) repeat protein
MFAGPVWRATQVTARLAATYYAAASAGADMRRVTELLESMRDRLSGSEPPFAVWDLLDDRVVDAHGSVEQSAFFELRAAYVAALNEALLAAIRSTYTEGTEAGWHALVSGYADAAIAWRFDVCKRLTAELPAPPEKGREHGILADAAGRGLDERWYETYPMYRLLAAQPFLSNAQVARLVAVEGLIELYHVFRHERARALLEQALQRAPDDPVVIASMGEYLLNRDNVAEARARFQRAIDIDPQLGSGYCLLGDCCLRENDMSAAEAWYRQAVAHRPGDYSGYGRLCRLFGKLKTQSDFPDRIPVLEERVALIDPRSVYDFDLEAGAAYQEREDFDRAHELYQRAIALDPARISGYTSEGYLFLEQARLDDARLWFRKATDVAPEALDGYWGLALTEEQAEQWAEAERWYAKSLPLRPEWDGILHANIAWMHAKLGRLADAKAGALDAIRRDPADEAVLAKVEQIADDLARTHNDLATARGIYDGIRSSVGESYKARHLNQIGVLLSAAGKHADAAEAFKAAIAADPDKASYRVSLAREVQELGAWDLARSLFDTAPLSVRSDASFRSEMALVRNAEANQLFARKEYHRAVPLFEEAIAFTPNDAVLHSNLALGREMDKTDPDPVRRLEGVRAALAEAFRLDPKNTEYSARLQNIEQLVDLAPIYGAVGLERLPVVTPIAVEVAADLIPLAEDPRTGGLTAAFELQLSAVRGEIFERYGVRIPGVRTRGNSGDLPPGSYVIMLMEVPTVMGTISLGQRFCAEPLATVQAKGIACDPASGPAGEDGCWIASAHWDAATAAGLPLWAVEAYPARHVGAVVERNLADFIGVNETYERVTETCFDLLPQLEQATGGVPGFTGALRALVAERATIAELRALCARYLELRRGGRNHADIVEELRAMAHIALRLPGNAAHADLISMGADFERRILDAVHRDGSQSVLAMLPDSCQETLREVRERLADREQAAIVVESATVRPFVRKLIEMEWPNVAVLSRREVEVMLGAQRKSSHDVAVGGGEAISGAS